MEHSRSKLPAMLAVLFCIALLAGVGVHLWKTLPEKQKPEQAETIQTDGVFSNEPTTVEPEREAPYEGELPGQAAQPETPDEIRRFRAAEVRRKLRKDIEARLKALQAPPSTNVFLNP